MELTIYENGGRRKIPPLIAKPLSSERCIYCNGELVAEPKLHCPKCAVQVVTDAMA